MFHNSSRMKILLIVCTFLATYSTVDALKCYTCSASEDDTDLTCISDPASAGTTNCDMAYCIIVRIDYVDPSGSLQSMTRGCVDNPIYLNKVIEDTTFRSYYSSCQTDLCNSGSGRDLTDLSSNIQGDQVTIFAPGTGSGHQVIISIFLIVFLQTFIFLL